MKPRSAINRRQGGYDQRLDASRLRINGGCADAGHGSYGTTTSQECYQRTFANPPNNSTFTVGQNTFKPIRRR